MDKCYQFPLGKTQTICAKTGFPQEISFLVETQLLRNVLGRVRAPFKTAKGSELERLPTGSIQCPIKVFLIGIYLWYVRYIEAMVVRNPPKTVGPHREVHDGV